MKGFLRLFWNKIAGFGFCLFWGLELLLKGIKLLLLLLDFFAPATYFSLHECAAKAVVPSARATAAAARYFVGDSKKAGLPL